MALSEEPPLEIEVTREQREREGGTKKRKREGRTKEEILLAPRNRNLSNLFTLFSSKFFYPFFLSFSPRTTRTTDDAGTTRGRRDVT